jgi:hypothetical protein
MSNEVQDKVRAGTVDRAKETRASVLKRRGNRTRGGGAGAGGSSGSRFNNLRSLPAPEDLFEQTKGFVDQQNLPSGRDHGGAVMSTTGRASVMLIGTRLRIQGPEGPSGGN